MSQEDEIERDRLLTNIDANLKNFMSRFDEHKVNFEKHILNDEKSLFELDVRIKTMEKIIWSIGGAFVVIELFLKFIK